MELLQVEVGGIQRYIFESARLREWRGASALLSRIDRAVLPDVLEGEPAEIVRSGGGVAILKIKENAPEETANQIEQELLRAYEDEAAGARAHSARVSGDEPATKLLSRLALEANLKREQEPDAEPDAALLGPMTRFCDSCGKRPAEKHRTLGGDGELVCRRCYQKGDHGGTVRRGYAESSAISRFGRYLSEEERSPEGSGRWPDPGDLPERVPADLTALAETDPNGEVALILADGNALGKSVQQIGDLETYRSFSESIAEAVETSVFEVLAQHPPENGGPLPWEIVFLGGDDVLLLTGASIALPVAETLSEKVAERTAPLTEPHGRDHLSMGIGVVAADPHVPISVLNRLAGELEDSAKELAYAREEEVTTIDFHRITGEGSTTLRRVREEILRPERDYLGGRHDEPTRLTGRPFTLSRLQRVREVAREWQEAGLPRSKLQAVREALYESPAEAMRTWSHVVARAPDSRREAWQRLADLTDPAAQPGDLELPWTTPSSDSQEASASRQTYLLDVLEVLALEGG